MGPSEWKRSCPAVSCSSELAHSGGGWHPDGHVDARLVYGEDLLEEGSLDGRLHLIVELVLHVPQHSGGLSHTT